MQAIYLISFFIFILLVLINYIFPRNNLVFIFNISIFFQSLTIFLLQTIVPFQIGIFFIFLSSYYLYDIFSSSSFFPNFSVPKSKAHNIFSTISSNSKFFYLVGGFLILSNFFYEQSSSNEGFGRYNLLIFGLGLIWLSYPKIPQDLGDYRDFIFLFYNIIVFFLIVPEIWYSLSTENGHRSSFIERHMYSLFVKPLTNILTILGYEAWGENQTLSYRTNDGGLARVFIADMCSGIYSVYIFTAAFMSYIYITYRRFDLFVFSLFIIGVFASYIANLIRMFSIILVGHYWGEEALYWAHQNLGWIIFIIWIWIFWTFILEKLLIEEPKHG